MRMLLNAISGVALTASLLGAAQQAPVGYDDTPMQPNGKWHIHDGKRPQPTVVTPAAMNAAPPPQDALVLVGAGADRSAWQMMDGTAVTWPMNNGELSTGKGMIRTRAEFTDVQLHVEFATPKEVKGNSQERGNSGVFLNGKFEIQVLDSFQNRTYADGSASAMYGQFPPMVNASRPPGEWQAYDIAFTAPRFGAGGTLTTPAIVTVLHNGIIVHHATPFWGPTAHKKIDPYTADNAKGPIALQDHGNPVRYRNIWIRPLAGDNQ
jgi:hypothetical protein